MSATEKVVALPSRLPKYGDAHVPAGEYAAGLAGCETWQRCHGWAPRLVLVFTIMDGNHFGVAIPGFYRVARLTGSPRRNGQFVIGTKSRLYRDLARMLGRKPPTTSVPVEELERTVYSVIVRDVTTDSDEHPLAGARYSVVDWVRGRA